MKSNLIRQATVYDLPDLYTLNCELRAEELNQWANTETPYPNQPHDAFDKEQFAKDRLPLLYNSNYLFLIAVDSAGQSVGYMLSSVYQRQTSTPQVVLSIHEMYIRRNERRIHTKSVSSLLTAETRSWAKSLSASSIEISSIGAAKQVHKWTRKGYKVFKVYLQKELD